MEREAVFGSGGICSTPYPVVYAVYPLGTLLSLEHRSALSFVPFFVIIEVMSRYVPPLAPLIPDDCYVRFIIIIYVHNGRRLFKGYDYICHQILSSSSLL